MRGVEWESIGNRAANVGLPLCTGLHGETESCREGVFHKNLFARFDTCPSRSSDHCLVRAMCSLSCAVWGLARAGSSV